MLDQRTAVTTASDAGQEVQVPTRRKREICSSEALFPWGALAQQGSAALTRNGCEQAEGQKSSGKREGN